MKNKIKIKNKMISIAAFLVVMIAMTGLAAAYDATIDKHDPVTGHADGSISDPILVYPGQILHVHFDASNIDPRVINPPTGPSAIDYILPISVTPLNAIAMTNPSAIAVTFNGYTNNLMPKFTPTATHFVDDDPHEILFTVSSNAPFDATYKIVIPTFAENGFGNGSASRNVDVISPNTTLTKTASPTTLTLNPGGSGTVTYTITETNTGDVPLMTTVNDPGVLGASCTPTLPDTRQYNPGASVTFTCTKTYNDSEQGLHINNVTATSNPIVDNTTITNITVNESASATVNVITNKTPCPTGDCKFKTWGLLGNVANPEKKFQMLFFSPIPNGGPQGSMTVEDNVMGMTIESTQVTSIVTDKNAGTGTAMGRAHVTGGPHPGDYDFTVNVVDAAHSGTPRGTFEIILQGFPGGYDNKGNLTFGVISLIK